MWYPIAVKSLEHKSHLNSQLLLYCATCFVGTMCNTTRSTQGASPWEGESGAEVRIVTRKVVRRACAGQTFLFGTR